MPSFSAIDFFQFVSLVSICLKNGRSFVIVRDCLRCYDPDLIHVFSSTRRTSSGVAKGCERLWSLDTKCVKTFQHRNWERNSTLRRPLTKGIINCGKVVVAITYHPEALVQNQSQKRSHIQTQRNTKSIAKLQTFGDNLVFVTKYRQKSNHRNLVSSENKRVYWAKI